MIPSSAAQKKVEAQFDLLQGGVARGDYSVQVRAETLIPLVEFLRKESDLAFDSFVDLCGVDYLDRRPRFEVVIHLYSTSARHRIRVRCQVPDDSLTVPSLTPYWKAANWQEREAFDMYGIRFQGHPDLKRILSPPDTQEFPQRKDYPLKGDRDLEEDL